MITKDIILVFREKLLIGLFAMILCCAFLLSCSKSTSPLSATIEGKVLFLNDISAQGLDTLYAEGVKIGLYRIVDQHVPNISTNMVGSSDSQEMFFDHRDHAPIMITETDNLGNYAFDQVPLGRYNIAYIKESWGYRYIYDIEITNTDIILGKATVPLVTLYPVRIIQNASDMPDTIEQFRVYLVQEDISLLSNLDFEGGAVVLLDSNTTLNLLGTIKMIDNGHPLRILSSDGIDSLEKKELRFRFDKVSLYKSVDIRSLRVSDAYAGLMLNGSHSTISNGIFVNCTNGVVVNANHVVIQRSSFVNINGRAIEIMQTSTNEPGCPSANMSNNLFLKCTEGIKTNGNNINIESNIFSQNQVGIVSNSGFHTIRNNEFDGNHRSIICSGSCALIKDNAFLEVGDSHLYFVSDYYMDYVTPDVSGNNFLNLDDYYVYIVRGSVRTDILAMHNYWAVENVSELIIDINDNPELGGKVIYLPRLVTPNPLAGIID